MGASSLPPLVDRESKVALSADETLFSVHFDAKYCRDSVVQPHSSPVLCSVVFRSSFVRSLLLNLVLYGGNDPDGLFPLFL